MLRCQRVMLMALAWLALVPSAVHAQGFIVGAVRDTSGAVLPGVTVEAASPALIEKTRSVVTDSTGQYRIENLRPGSYTVTFTLPGFNTAKREGIELTGSFTASVNVEMRVGALEETITVTGETPIVDVQSATRERVLNQEMLDALPASRNPVFLAALLPGVTTANQDVGGLLGTGRRSGAVTVHGNGDVRTLVNGQSRHSANGGGDTGVGNLAAYQEVVVDTGGISAEQKEGGVRINLIPRDGGNTFQGYFFGAFANDSMQGNNFTQDLKDRGLSTPDAIKQFWDINPAYGGPILRDKIWFHTTIRYTGSQTFANIFFNKNAGDPNAWAYEPDVSRGPAWNNLTFKNGTARLTWQATPKNKIAATYDHNIQCECPRGLGATVSPEANLTNHAPLDPKRYMSADWTAPATNRVLFEAGALIHDEQAFRPLVNIHFPVQPAVKLSSVTEQSTGLTYRASTGGSKAWNRTRQYRATMSYITGAHAFKVGLQLGTATQDFLQYDIDSAMSFRFNNGVPNQITLRATPFRAVANLDADHGVFVQDKWTVHRWTLTAGLRYDYFHNSFPQQTVGPGQFAPTRNIVLPATDGGHWHDLEPRTGLVYDIFGDGRTALKVSLNKYLATRAVDRNGVFEVLLAPSSRLVTTATRSWTDANRNFVPDCELTNPGANGECAAMSNPNFGSGQLTTATVYDPDTLRGWGHRDFNWEFSVGVQREIIPRVSMDVSYFRRWFGNFIVTDNRAVGPSDFDSFSIAAPVDPRLPGGGGYTIAGLYDLKPASFGRPADNYLTFSKDFGKQIQHWNGVDITFDARVRAGLMFQGGMSTGRTVTDNCDVIAKVPEALFGGAILGTAVPNVWIPASNCHQESPFLTQVKALATYTVPRIDVQVTGTLQNIPGPQILANYVATNAVVSPSLGRSLSGNASNVTVHIVEAGALYGERLNQIDLRIGKIMKLGRARATPSLDIYNVLNTNTVLTLSNAFATWERPQSILNARFAKIGVQIDF